MQYRTCTADGSPVGLIGWTTILAKVDSKTGSGLAKQKDSWCPIKIMDVVG